MRNKVQLVTLSDAQDFVNIVSKCNGKIIMRSSDEFAVNAKSMLGVLASLEWGGMWVESEEDIYSKIEKYVVI